MIQVHKNINVKFELKNEKKTVNESCSHKTSHSWQVDSNGHKRMLTTSFEAISREILLIVIKLHFCADTGDRKLTIFGTFCFVAYRYKCHLVLV